MNRTRAAGGAGRCPGAGLVITDNGLAGLVVEMTQDYSLAVARHQRLVEHFDQLSEGPPAGGILLLSLPINEAVLDFAALQAATKRDSSSVYACNGVPYIEWSTAHGWRDRREVSGRTAELIYRNGGNTAVTEADWRWAASVLRAVRVDPADPHLWKSSLDDARAWWFPHLPGPLFAHAIGLRKFQVLPRAALARIASGQPQVADERQIAGCLSDALLQAQASRVRGDEFETLDDVVAFAGRTARHKGSKDHGRALIAERVRELLPLAAKEGRNQFIVLAAVGHAVEVGGVRGTKWAPVTIYEYIRIAPREIVKALSRVEFDAVDGQSWYAMYQSLLAKARLSQRAKFAAFLEVFHRYLVIAGAEPLPRSLAGRGVPLPPAAAVVTSHELELALQYVAVRAPTDRIRLQAQLALVLAFWIPLRPAELWCLRIVDVQLEDPMYVVIYPRRRDGEGKTPATRRQEQVSDPRLCLLLTDMKQLRRCVDHANDGDLLLGEPGKPECRHEEILTGRLVVDALRWATGDSSAGFYDLRHTAFSRRVASILGGTAHGI